MADRVPVKLRNRRTDLIFLVFFAVNLGFITYLFDIEQLTVKDAVGFTYYPAWPPKQIVDLVHWYGNHYDPLLMARPAFFRMTIWMDVVAFGPFYAAAIYAFIRGRDWIRVPALVWSGMMMANVLIILFEERAGDFATHHFRFVLGVNLPWLLLPVAVIWRLFHDHPFTELPTEPATELSAAPPDEPALPDEPAPPDEPATELSTALPDEP